MQVVAIDGPAGAGKSTIARALAERLGWAHLDTGAMYRAVTLAALRAELHGDEPEVAEIARTMALDVGTHVLLDGEDVTAPIRAPEVNLAVSVVAANSPVRDELRDRQRAWAVEHGGGVIEGRDIGSVVFPDAVLKLYLTASPRVRAERRVAEHGGDVAAIEADIARRDGNDQGRADGPLTRADGAVVVDTSGMTIHEVLDEIERLLGGAGSGMTKIETKLAGNSRVDRAAYFVVRNLLFIFLKVWCRLRVEGSEHLPKEGLFVLAPTHRSIIDTPVASGVASRRLRFLGADKWWSNKWFGRLLSALGGFPVTRGTADREALMRCIGVLEAGEPLVLFPEGERKSGPLVQPLLDGAVYIAMKTRVPIVPVGIGGSEKAMPKGTRFIYPHKIVAIIGEPIHPPVDDSGRVLRTARRDVTAQLHDELQRLYDLAQIRANG